MSGTSIIAQIFVPLNLEMMDSALANKSSHCMVVKTDFLVRRLKF